jgi:ketosteroid isomerase-like protein
MHADRLSEDADVVTELLVAELTLESGDAEKAFLKLNGQPELPEGCMRIERARSARPRTYFILTWWTDATSRKKFEVAGTVWPGADVTGVARLERTTFTQATSSTIRGLCPDCGEVVPSTVRPAGEVCSICGAALAGRPEARTLPSPPGALPVGLASDLRGVDLDPEAQRAIEQYFQAWNTPDATARRPLLETSLAEDARYQDPATPEAITGRDGINQFIDATLRRFAGLSVELLHGYGRGRLVTVEWRMILPTPTGPSVTPGIDVVEMRDGRIARIVAYYDRGPAVWQQAARAFA